MKKWAMKRQRFWPGRPNLAAGRHTARTALSVIKWLRASTNSTSFFSGWILPQSQEVLECFHWGQIFLHNFIYLYILAVNKPKLGIKFNFDSHQIKKLCFGTKPAELTKKVNLEFTVREETTLKELLTMCFPSLTR